MPRQMVRMVMEMPRGVRDVNWMLNAPRLITSNTSWSHADMCIQSRGMKNKKERSEARVVRRWRRRRCDDDLICIEALLSSTSLLRQEHAGNTNAVVPRKSRKLRWGLHIAPSLQMRCSTQKREPPKNAIRWIYV
jgi:hypothetical protein